MSLACSLLAALALVGIVLALVQVAALWRHRRAPLPTAARLPPISILKPLCGVDDGLAENLGHFAQLDYPHYEVVLGVRDTRDPAYFVALRACERWPLRMRLVVQQGEPGLNPKVNQLLGLERAARHELLLISDSNVRVPDGYLQEIAALLGDPRVGLVTHPTAGVGEQRLGALLDSLQMTAGVGAGQVAAKRVGGQDLVVGKSMAFWRRDLQALGGFRVVKDVLAEDFVLGRLISQRLGKQVAVAQLPVYSIGEKRSVRSFLDRFSRWSVMQRQAVGPITYLGQAILNPLPFALAALAIDRSLAALALVLACVAAKMMTDGLAGALLRPQGYGLRALLAVPLKDLLVFAAWVHGLTHEHVTWRGTRLRVGAGTRLLAPPPAHVVEVPVEEPAARRRAA